MDKKTVINHLKELSARIGQNKVITQTYVRTVPKLDYYISLYFGKLANALGEAGLPASSLAKKMNVTNEKLLKYLKKLQSKLGRKPTTLDVTRDKKIYKEFADDKFSPHIFKTRFQGFRNALKQLDSLRNVVNSQTVDASGQKAETDNPEFFQNKPRFYGKAAELHVTAELLYHGFQAANIPVDEGLDILAVKRHKTFYFQVKHKDVGNNNNESIKVAKSSYEKRGGGDVYYIFVLLSKKKREFLVVPYHIIDDWIRTGLVEEKENGYLFSIRKDDDEYKLKDLVLNKYLDGWDNIK